MPSDPFIQDIATLHVAQRVGGREAPEPENTTHYVCIDGQDRDGEDRNFAAALTEEQVVELIQQLLAVVPGKPYGWSETHYVEGILVNKTSNGLPTEGFNG